MKYVGLHTQIARNNLKSVLLLVLFPMVIFILIWLFIYFALGEPENRIDFTNQTFLEVIPWISIAVLLWFGIAFFFNTTMIKHATGSAPLERKENKRIYNLVENLCISSGMRTPKINIIDDDSLNAFASGINTSSFTISLSRGIINKLDDSELEAVIAHELTHIRNRDVRLVIISVIFVGIFAFLTEALMRTLRYSSSSRSKKDGSIILIAMLLAGVGYLLSSIFRFALSKKREFLADAGSAEMTKNPLALASALEKISTDSRIEAVNRHDVAQLFIDNPREKDLNNHLNSFSTLFATHPPIEKRIALLRQF
jgi:heat shock protein HtpX